MGMESWLVKTGDNIWDIAASTLMSDLRREPTLAENVARMNEIIALNLPKLKGNPDLIFKGMVLDLPGGSGGAQPDPADAAKDGAKAGEKAGAGGEGGSKQGGPYGPSGEGVLGGGPYGPSGEGRAGPLAGIPEDERGALPPNIAPMPPMSVPDPNAPPPPPMTDGNGYYVMPGTPAPTFNPDMILNPQIPTWATRSTLPPLQPGESLDPQGPRRRHLPPRPNAPIPAAPQSGGRRTSREARMGVRPSWASDPRRTGSGSSNLGAAPPRPPTPSGNSQGFVPMPNLAPAPTFNPNQITNPQLPSWAGGR